MPGLGHPVHKEGDPRTPRIIGIAREEGLYGPHLALFEAVGRVHPDILGLRLPLNGAGVSGAALADLGLPLELLRGVVLLARCAGLLGHLAEEMRLPVANSIYLTVDRNAEYIPPPRTRRRGVIPAARPAGRGRFARICQVSPADSPNCDRMRAAVLRGHRSVPEVEQWQPPDPGPGEALVELRAAPITPLDLLCASGTSYFGPPELPYVPGVQGVGLVLNAAASRPGRWRGSAPGPAWRPATAACANAVRWPRRTWCRSRST